LLGPPIVELRLSAGGAGMRGAKRPSQPDMREFAYQSKLLNHSPTVNATTTTTAMTANTLSV